MTHQKKEEKLGEKGKGKNRDKRQILTKIERRVIKREQNNREQVTTNDK